MAFLGEHPGLGYPAAAGLGLALGSFLNVVILRLPRRLEWLWILAPARSDIKDVRSIVASGATHIPHIVSICGVGGDITRLR